MDVPRASPRPESSGANALCIPHLERCCAHHLAARAGGVVCATLPRVVQHLNPFPSTCEVNVEWR
jgi:hypothetical protein